MLLLLCGGVLLVPFEDLGSPRDRLRRICSALGNHDIRFVSCSATISNPAKVKRLALPLCVFSDVSLQHMEAILGVQNIHVVSIDGSPSGRKVRQPFHCSVQAKRSFGMIGARRLEPTFHRQGKCYTRSRAHHLGGIESLPILDGSRRTMYCLLQGTSLAVGQQRLCSGSSTFL